MNPQGREQEPKGNLLLRSNRRSFLTSAVGVAGGVILEAAISPLDKIRSIAEAAPVKDGGGVETSTGRFYNETNGGVSPEMGYYVRGPMLEVYDQAGREQVWGASVSRQYVDELGRVCQAFQRGIFQLTMESGRVTKEEWMNVFDELSAKGKDDWLEAARQTPKSGSWPQDAGKNWDEIVANRLELLNQNPAIREEYMKDPLRIEKYGLPVAMKNYGNVVVVRCQRGTFQQWTQNVPWAKAGEVKIALGGDIAKEAGLLKPKDTALEHIKSYSVIEAQIPNADMRPCSPWPAKVVEMLKRLSVVDGLCFAHYTDRSQIPYADLRESMQQDGSGGADWDRRMVQVLASNEVQRDWFELIVGHEVSHFHQIRVILEAGLGPPNRGPSWQDSYIMTPEGEAYLAARSGVINEARRRGIDIATLDPFRIYGQDPYEDAADICSMWGIGRQRLTSDVWAPMREFARQWWFS